MIIELTSDPDNCAEHEANHAAVVFALGYSVKYLAIDKLSAAQKKAFKLGKSATGACEPVIPESDKAAWIKVLLAGVYFGMGDEDDRECVTQLLAELHPNDEAAGRQHLSKLGDDVLELLDQPGVKLGIAALANALNDEGVLDGAHAEELFKSAQKK
jgi:hypothetical protein